jgi:hypothetical protein
MPSSLRNPLAVNTAFDGCEYDVTGDGNWGQYADIEIQLVNNYNSISLTKHVNVLPTIVEIPHPHMHNNVMNGNRNIHDKNTIFIDIMTKKIHIIGFICILTLGNILLQ